MVPSENKQFKILGLLSLGFLTAIGILYYVDSTIFQRFLGNLNPIATGILVVVLGFLATYLLFRNGSFAVYKRSNKKVFLLHSLFVLVFSFVSVFVDCSIVYPENMNILLPEALLFYPVMGFLVEIVFHVVPFALLLIVSLIFKTTIHQKLLWVTICVVALLEPTYQIYMDAYPVWAMIVVWINLFLFNVLQLFVFTRYDFVSMYALRLVYYLFWHVIWGSLRLEIIF